MANTTGPTQAKRPKGEMQAPLKYVNVRLDHNLVVMGHFEPIESDGQEEVVNVVGAVSAIRCFANEKVQIIHPR